MAQSGAVPQPRALLILCLNQQLIISLRVGDGPFYGSDRNSTAFFALGEAGIEVGILFQMILDTLPLVPGPVGIWASASSSLIALERGDYAGAAWRAVATVARLSPCRFAVPVHRHTAALVCHTVRESDQLGVARRESLPHGFDPGADALEGVARS